MLERYGRNGGPVHREGCGVPQNGTPRDTVHLHRRPLQPPRATVHPPSTSSSLHLRLFIHGLLFIQPPPRATPPATVQPALSTGSCSTTPPRATFHPALHHLLFIQPSTGRPIHLALHGALFIQPQPARSIGVLFIQRQHHGVLFIHPHLALFIHPPRNTHCSSRGSIDHLQLEAVAKESLDRVQLIAIDRSLGFSNA